MKKWFGRLVTMVVSASLVSGICGQVAYADAVSITENGGTVSENTGQAVTELLVVSDEDGNVLSVEENSNDIPALGHRYDRAIVAQQQAVYTDCITFVIPESDTWSFEQTFARGELFDEFQKARMDSNNWWYYTNNGGEPLVK